MVRFKNRYIIVHLKADGNKKVPGIQSRNLYQSLITSLTKNFGEVGIGLMQQSLQVIYYNATTSIAVIRCARDHTIYIQASLTFITELHHQDVKLETLQICGSNRTCKASLLALSLKRIDANAPSSIKDTITQEIDALESREI